MEKNQKIKRYCQFEFCKSPKRALPKIGSSRLNGNMIKHDWESRKYHKQCYKQLRIMN